MLRSALGALWLGQRSGAFPIGSTLSEVILRIVAARRVGGFRGLWRVYGPDSGWQTFGGALKSATQLEVQSESFGGRESAGFLAVATSHIPAFPQVAELQLEAKRVQPSASTGPPSTSSTTAISSAVSPESAPSTELAPSTESTEWTESTDGTAMVTTVPP